MHWLEGGFRFEYSGVTTWLAVYGYSISYFLVFPVVAVAMAWALARRTDISAYRVFSLAIAIDYAVSLPFFLFFPVPERWAYPEASAALLSDQWSTRLIEAMRPMSGLDSLKRYYGNLFGFKKPTLREQAHQFHQRLRAIKNQTELTGGQWYPWNSLAAMNVLDTFVKGDIAELRRMIGDDPVLDLGCGDGDIAFFFESLGAHVDAVDYDPTNYNGLAGIRTLKQKLGSPVRIHSTDLDARPNLPSSKYGFTLLLGLLYHLKNPFLVLETLARHSRYVLLSTRIAAVSPDGQTSFAALPVAYLVDEFELNQDDTNYWIFSEEGFKRIVRRSGWEVMHYAAVGPAEIADPVSPAADTRGYILAKSRRGPPPSGFRLLRGWHQLEYDSWRWTERRFSVELDLSAAMDPAMLRFVFEFPAQVFATSTEITLSARVNDAALPPRTYSTPGEHEFTGIAGALNRGIVTVEFELDRAIPPSDADRRELGMLVHLSGAAPVILI